MAVTLTQPSQIKRLVAAGNDEFWFEDHNVAAGTMVELSAANGDIDTTDQLTVFEYYQKAVVVNGANLKIADLANTELTVSALTTAPTVNSIVTQATSGAQMVVDSVDSTKTKIRGFTITGTFTTTAGHTLSGGGMDPTTEVPSAVNEATTTPLWYDIEVHPDAASGSLPTQAYLGCKWAGRLVLSGNPDYPHQWYMSRVADHTDWAYLAGDDLAPIAGANADAGEIGDIVTCLLPYTDDYMIFGCASSIHLLRGNPHRAGSIDAIDETTGIFGPKAWCLDDKDNVWFWGMNGVYKMSPKFAVEHISNIAIPELVEDESVDPATHRIEMEYDRKNHGILITITLLADGTNSNYFVSLTETATGIFPEAYPVQCGVYSTIFYDATDKTYRDMLVGCKDGYIRKFDPTAKDDDIGGSDTAVDSYVLYPIVQMGEPDFEGKLYSLTINVSGGASSGSHTDSDGADVDYYTADDAETLIEDVKDGAAAFYTETLTGTGRNQRIRERMRGAWAGFKFSNSNASETFSINRVLADITEAGRIR
ncbi:MAG: hypothetical protein ACXABY_05060 [Candidatus Thorarchaeota archaeon]|jgi:hypothetical protein